MTGNLDAWLRVTSYDEMLALNDVYISGISDRVTRTPTRRSPLRNVSQEFRLMLISLQTRKLFVTDWEIGTPPFVSLENGLVQIKKPTLSFFVPKSTPNIPQLLEHFMVNTALFYTSCLDVESGALYKNFSRKVPVVTEWCRHGRQPNIGMARTVKYLPSTDDVDDELRAFDDSHNVRDILQFGDDALGHMVRVHLCAKADISLIEYVVVACDRFRVC
jgi:hypothetical protein